MPDAGELDPFEYELNATDILFPDGLDDLQRKVGLGGGGCWWIDPSQTPVELDKNGNIDEGAIMDVEAEAHAWLRRSFDHNPEFRDEKYHLLSRLNELARLKGLVEEAELRHQTNGDQNYEAPCDKQLYHSTLNLAGDHGVPESQSQIQNGTQNLVPTDIRRSMEGSIARANLEGTYALRDSEQAVNYSRRDSRYRIPIQEIFSDPPPPVSPSPYSYPQAPNEKVFPKNPAISRPFARLSGLPQIHKSHQPPSPHNFPTYSNKNGGNPNGSMIPNATSSPDRVQGNFARKGDMLSRTYSKEQLSVLKGDNSHIPRKDMNLSKSAKYLQPTLTSSLPLSGSDSDVDVSKSLDVSHGKNLLSKSLGDAELQAQLLRAGIKTNASYSSMQSADVFDIARLQESHLRKHSASRTRLNGSSSPLMGSVEDFRRDRSGSADNRSGSNISDIDNLRVSADDGILRRRSPVPKDNLTVSSFEQRQPSAEHLAGLHLSQSRNPSPKPQKNSPRPLNVSYDLDAKEVGKTILLNMDPDIAAKIGPDPNGENIRNLDDGMPPYISQKTVVHTDPSYAPDNGEGDVLGPLNSPSGGYKRTSSNKVTRIDSQRSFEQLEAEIAEECGSPVQKTSVSDLNYRKPGPEPQVSIVSEGDLANGGTEVEVECEQKTKATTENRFLPDPAFSVPNPQPSRPPTASRIPSLSAFSGQNSRLPTPSSNLPSVSARSRPGSSKPSGLPPLSSRLPTSRNSSAESVSGLRQPRAGLTIVRDDRSSSKRSSVTEQQPRTIIIKADRSEASPVRSVTANRWGTRGSADRVGRPN
ncbi:unnamed protein product [Calicophoron daubneyi]|uniref:Uncharacterized protein n=1 Tax=Calicophoron daubneyi TaxID=300641 RepID=A0AAV2T901_CALDB